MHFRPFGELVRVAPAGELFGIDEEILAAVLLARAGRPRGARDGELEAGDRAPAGASTRVLFPAPDGPETMKTMP